MDQESITWREEEALSPGITSQQYQTLLEVSEAIAPHRELKELFQDLSKRLRGVVQSECIGLVLHDPARDMMRLHFLESDHPNGCTRGIEMPVDDAPGGWVWKTQRPLLIPDLTLESRFPKVTPLLRDQAIRSFCMVPLTTSRRRLGAMGFGSMREGTYGDADLAFLQQVAKQVAVAVENALNYETAQSYQQALTRERDRLRLLLDVNNAVVSTLDLRTLFTAISANLRRVLRADMIPTEVMAALTRYPWPGNVRELENLIERAVILSQGPTLRAPLGELMERTPPPQKKLPAESAFNGTATLEAAERKHILRVLEETGWVIGGPAGAAAYLGMKRTTLQSKMARLGMIRRLSVF